MLSVGCVHNRAIVRGWVRIASRRPQVKSNGGSNLEPNGVHWLKDCVLDKHLIQVRWLSALLVFVIKFQLLLLKKTFLMRTAFWKRSLLCCHFNVESIKMAVFRLLWFMRLIQLFPINKSDSFLVNREYWAVLLKTAFGEAICSSRNTEHKWWIVQVLKMLPCSCAWSLLLTPFTGEFPSAGLFAVSPA